MRACETCADPSQCDDCTPEEKAAELARTRLRIAFRCGECRGVNSHPFCALELRCEHCRAVCVLPGRAAHLELERGSDGQGG